MLFIFFPSSITNSHPKVHFSVYSSPKTGQPWGTFTTDAKVRQEGGGPFYNDETPNIRHLSANKVSSYQESDQWHSVLLAPLRFKPDHLEPISDTMQDKPFSPHITHQEAAVSHIGTTSGEPVTYKISAESNRSFSLFLADSPNRPMEPLPLPSIPSLHPSATDDENAMPR